MSSVFLACLLFILVTGAQAKEKQIKLEDIERDNLAAERYAKTGKPHQQPFNYQHYQSYQPQHQHRQFQQHRQQQQHHQSGGVQGTPTPPRMQYGFVPLKSSYQQQAQAQAPVEQREQVQYQYATSPSHTQAYLPTVSPVRQSGHAVQSPGIQYAVQQPEEQPQPPPHHKYAVPIQTQAYQQYIQGQSGHIGQTQIQYVPESQVQYYQQPQQSQGHSHQYQQPQQQQPQQHHQHPQIQYVVDNSIQPTPQEEQKYYQQFVYIQPYQTPSASSNIHSIADTKGNDVQYVMYIPAGVPNSATYQGETVLAYPTNQETQYVYQPVLERVESPQNSQHSQYSPVQKSSSSSSDDSDISRAVVAPKAPKYERPLFKHQPTSLLDSYVPSYLQYQYYKQQQTETANAIKQSSLKLGSTDVGKTDVVKSYKGETSNY